MVNSAWLSGTSPPAFFRRLSSPTASQSHLIIDTAAWTSGQASCQGCGDPSLERCDGVGDVPLGSEGHVPLVCKLREEQLFRSSRHSLLLRGDRLPLGDQKGVGGDAQRGMVVEAAPSPPFIVADPYFLFQIQIIALDAPAEFGRIGERLQSPYLRE